MDLKSIKRATTRENFGNAERNWLISECESLMRRFGNLRARHSDIDPKIIEIANQMVLQDNLATNLPVFCVQQKRRIYGVDVDHTDDRCLLNEYGEDICREDAEEGETLTEVGYKDQWEFVTACFTRRGCEDYIAVNGHNLCEPRIYVESGCRNAEWERLRKWLLGLATLPKVQADRPKSIRMLLGEILGNNFRAAGFRGAVNHDRRCVCFCGDFMPCCGRDPRLIDAVLACEALPEDPGMGKPTLDFLFMPALRSYLLQCGFDGLYNETVDCACRNVDLAPCECEPEDILSCIPGYAVACTCGNHGDWRIASDHSYRCKE